MGEQRRGRSIQVILLGATFGHIWPLGHSESHAWYCWLKGAHKEEGPTDQPRRKRPVVALDKWLPAVGREELLVRASSHRFP